MESHRSSRRLPGKAKSSASGSGSQVASSGKNTCPRLELRRGDRHKARFVPSRLNGDDSGDLPFEFLNERGPGTGVFDENALRFHCFARICAAALRAGGAGTWSRRSTKPFHKRRATRLRQAFGTQRVGPGHLQSVESRHWFGFRSAEGQSSAPRKTNPKTFDPRP
jgi:hypothetical protein